MKTISLILLFGLLILMSCGQSEPKKEVQDSSNPLPVAKRRLDRRQRAEYSTVGHPVNVMILFKDKSYSKPEHGIEPNFDPKTDSIPLDGELATSLPSSQDQTQIMELSNEEIEGMFAFFSHLETESFAKLEGALSADWTENQSLESHLTVLSQAVLSDDRDVRMDAVISLSLLGKEAVLALSQALTDDDRDIRLNAIQSLEQIGDEAAPARFQALLDDDRDIRYDTVTALGRLGQKAAPIFNQALTDDDRDIRLHAVNSLFFWFTLLKPG